MPLSPSRPHAAYLEEYNEEAHTTIPETRQTANVAAKRSKPDIAKVKVAGLGHDEASDSGQSNHTMATLGSGESSLESKSGSATLTLDTSAEGLAVSKRKPPGVGKQTRNTLESPQKPSLRRSDSKARPKGSARQKNCDCAQCQNKEKTKGSQPALPSDAPTVKLQDTSKKPLPSPPKASNPSLPQTGAEAPVVQPAQPRPRNPGSQSYRRARPVSFHGVIPETIYYPPVVFGRPPPSFPVQPSFSPPSYPPPGASYLPPPYHSAPPSQQHGVYPVPISPYEPNPPTRHWNPEPHPPARQTMMYDTPPIVEYSHPPQYGTHPPSFQPPPLRSFSERDRERSAPLRKEYFPDEDYYRMPPPPLPPKVPTTAQSHQRPTIRHAATVSTHVPHHGRHSADEAIEERSGRRSPRKANGENRERSRRPSISSRQAAAAVNDKPSEASNLERSFARMSIEGNDATAAAKRRRRVTYYGGEGQKDLERQIEAYQAENTASSNADSIPLTADSLKLVRRKTQTSNSDVGSRASGEGRASKDGSDVKPRSSTGNRASSDIKTRNENDSFTMRFNASQDINVDLKGGEGRTISLRQSREGEGNMELSIGAKNEAKEKGRRRQSYVDDNSVRQLEYERAASRIGRLPRDAAEDSKARERLLAGNRSRRSSRSARALVGA